MSTDDIINNFIDNNCSEYTREMAEDLNIELIFANDNKLNFISNNLYKESYNIEISTENNKIITHCNCDDFIDNIQI